MAQEPLGDYDEAEDCRRSYTAALRQLRLQGIREGRLAPIQTDSEEMEAAREALDPR